MSILSQETVGGYGVCVDLLDREVRRRGGDHEDVYASECYLCLAGVPAASQPCLKHLE